MIVHHWRQRGSLLARALTKVLHWRSSTTPNGALLADEADVQHGRLQRIHMFPSLPFSLLQIELSKQGCFQLAGLYVFSIKRALMRLVIRLVTEVFHNDTLACKSTKSKSNVDLIVTPVCAETKTNEAQSHGTIWYRSLWAGLNRMARVVMCTTKMAAHGE